MCDAAMLVGWNYLRVRGEYIVSPPNPNQPRELPPRARRIHNFDGQIPVPIGTTSACAENTWG